MSFLNLVNDNYTKSVKKMYSLNCTETQLCISNDKYRLLSAKNVVMCEEFVKCINVMPKRVSITFLFHPRLMGAN